MNWLKLGLDFPLFEISDSVITPAKLALALAVLVGISLATRWVERRIWRRLAERPGGDSGALHAIAPVARYGLLVAVAVVVLETMGVDLSGLVVMFGTLGLGVGLALQPLLTNFVSGVVLLLERSIKVGDRIEVGTLVGDVTRISPRSTIVVTNDKIAVVVPNSLLASSQIINWSHSGRLVRFRIPVGVAYSSDPDLVARVLVEVAENHPGVLRDPAPDVLFDGFGDSALNFVLRIATHDFLHRPGVMRSEINFAIQRAFRRHGIQIPFPQRDVHIHTSETSLPKEPTERAAGT